MTIIIKAYFSENVNSSTFMSFMTLKIFYLIYKKITLFI